MSERPGTATWMRGSSVGWWSTRLSLKVGLHWLFNNLPALEELDLLARVIVVDPDGISGNGDEFFQTVGTGGAPVAVGSVSERKERLDTVFTTSLGVSF